VLLLLDWRVFPMQRFPLRHAPSLWLALPRLPLWRHLSTKTRQPGESSPQGAQQGSSLGAPTLAELPRAPPQKLRVLICGATLGGLTLGSPPPTIAAAAAAAAALLDVLLTPPAR